MIAPPASQGLLLQSLATSKQRPPLRIARMLPSILAAVLLLQSLLCCLTTESASREPCCPTSGAVPPRCIPSEATARCGAHGHPRPPAAGPAFHFHDSSCGSNDPNAPLWDPKHRLYHIFYQSHEPGGTSWGHGVSADMVYVQQSD